MSRVLRAAFIAEMDDGTKMLYELDPNRVITLSVDYPDAELDWTLTRVHQGDPHMTVEGTMLRGTVWEGDVPTAGEAQGELTEKPRELTS